MTEPKRWLEDGAPEPIERMLRAASAEQPQAGAIERTLASVALGASVLGTGAGAQAAGAALGAKGALVTSSVVAKWTLVGVAATLGVAGVATSAFGPGAAQAPPARASAQGLSAPTKASVQQPSSPPAAPEVPKPPRGKLEPGTLPLASVSRPPRAERGDPLLAPQVVRAEEPIDAERLAEETQLVDSARELLAAGRAASALARLDEYTARYPAPRFAPEALYLRLEALLRLGDLAGAERAAAKLVADYPRSPHTARAEALLKKP